MKYLRLVAVPVLALLVSGCFGRNDGVARALFATAVVAAHVVARHPELLETEHRKEYPHEPPRSLRSSTSTQVAVDPPRRVDPSSASARPFDAARARAALGNVDLTRCREIGAPHGYGHANVTLNPSGDISKVVIDAPAGLPSDAAKCIGGELGRATVPVFTGSAVTVGTMWYVP